MELAVLLIGIAAICVVVGLLAVRSIGRPSSDGLSEAEQATLLRIARTSLAAELSGESAPDPPTEKLTPELQRPASAFVTLTIEGRLRGCILDQFEPHEPLYRNVERNVLLAATADARFPPVASDELDRISIEISVLDAPARLAFDGPDDLLAKLRPGVHGVILTTPYGTSTFLPQVWDQVPGRADFLAELCRKQGAPADCWQDTQQIRIETYTVQHFGEGDQRPD